jgi:hypothetical protein
MAAVTKGLIYEGLKQLQSDMAGLKDACGEYIAALNAIRTQMVALRQDTQNIYTILSHHDGRLARIQRRLEITEPA